MLITLRRGKPDGGLPWGKPRTVQAAAKEPLEPVAEIRPGLTGTWASKKLRVIQ